MILSRIASAASKVLKLATPAKFFTLNNYNPASITAYDVAGGLDVVIPDNLKSTSGYAVKNIGTFTGRPFGNKGLTSIIIPDGFIKIETDEFAGGLQGNALTSVTLPNSITIIGDALLKSNQLTSVVIPNSVTSIGLSAFSTNQLTSVVIPNSVTSIGREAFYNNKLTSVVIPNSVTSIGGYAFRGNQLTSVVIPSGVKSIENYTFAYNQLTSVVIPDMVTIIKEGAFSTNKLTSVTIGSSVVTIQAFAFASNTFSELIMKPTIPPALSTAGSAIKSGTIIYVPVGSLTAYQTATNWSTYASQMVEGLPE